MMMKHKDGFSGLNRKLIVSVLLVALIVFGGCNMPTPHQVPGEPTPDMNAILTQIALEQPPTATTEPTPEPTATPEPKKVLTVCLGKEPETLFFYDESSTAMWSVLEAIYNGPFDRGDGESVPVIFEDIVTRSEPVEVIRGDIIVDVHGDPVELKPGTVFMPAEPAENCTGTGCLTSWTAVTESAEILQTTVTFRLKEGLTWNDGTPLTAEDSVFSMDVNGMKGINASKRIYNLTDSYAAVDEHTVEWKGLPGYAPADVSEVFWIPLPKHVMKGMNADAIRASESVTRNPLGWGAWQIASWTKGEAIVAERNPYYAGADGSQPYFDQIVYRFFGRAGDNNLEALHSGTCDIIDTSVDLSVDLEPILEDVRDGKEAVYIRPELTRQELVFNLNSRKQGAQEIFLSPELRLAVAQCIDRRALIRQVLYGQSEIPVDFFPVSHSEHLADLTPVPYDPEAAQEALETLGWLLPEDASATEKAPVRTAVRATGIIYGTELSLTLTGADTPMAGKAAEMIRDDLAACGISVETNLLPLGELYAQGPGGIIFGREFDAAMFSWAAGKQPCAVYMSDQIPDETNHWVGTNVGGYSGEEYDAACLVPGAAETAAGAIYAQDLPVIPLYFNISIGVSGNDICGISDKVGSRSMLWNMETFSRSEESCAVSQWQDIYR